MSIDEHRKKPTQTKQNVKGAGFTLVELLVVVAIIALLLAILMPSMDNVRAVTRSVKCASNLKQWGLATHAYANDHNGYLFNTRNQPGGANWWYMLLTEDKGYLPPLPDQARAGEYGPGSVGMCPSAARIHVRVSGGNNAWINYATNRIVFPHLTSLTDPDDYVAHRIEDFDQPYTAIAIVDGPNRNRAAYPLGVAECQTRGDAWLPAWQYQENYNHLTRSNNGLMVDASVVTGFMQYSISAPWSHELLGRYEWFPFN